METDAAGAKLHNFFKMAALKAYGSSQARD